MLALRLRFRLLWLTLLAFGMQVAVADFHHHVTRGTGIEARAITAGMCRLAQDKPCPPLQKEHDGCVLCWAASIAAVSLTPKLFDLSPPAVLHGVKLRVADPATIRVARIQEFRARGPPSAVG